MKKQVPIAVALVLALSSGAAIAQDTTTPTSPDSGTSTGTDTGTDTSTGTDTDTSTGTGTDTSTGTDTGTSTGTGTDTTTGTGTTTGGTATGGMSVDITPDQQTEIRTIITEEDVDPIEVDFDITLGTVVPSTVVLLPLPPRIVTILPQFEGFLFFMLADGRIVIVDPDTLEIVLIIDA